MTHHDTLLIPEEPLQVLPGLATRFGLNEAIVLQQIHYWINPKRNIGKEWDGRRWVYNTYTQWQQDNFPFWSVDTIKRVMLKMERDGLIESTDTLNSDSRDRTKWYTINYDALHGGEGNLPPSRGGQSALLDEGNLPRSPYTETTPETTAEITLGDRVKNIEDSIHREDFAAVWAIYPKKEAKADALKAWKQLDPPVSLVAIIQQAVLQQTENNWAGRETRFIPSLGPWLRGRRWEDAIVAPTQTNGTKPRLGKHGQRVYSPDELIERARKEMGG
jgi:hypothetical protein